MAPPKPPLGLARTLRNDIYIVAGGSHDRLVQIGELGLRHPHTAIPMLEAALALAIERGWLTGEGEPLQAVRLTEAGRQHSAKERKRP